MAPRREVGERTAAGEGVAGAPALPKDANRVKATR